MLGKCSKGFTIEIFTMIPPNRLFKGCSVTSRLLLYLFINSLSTCFPDILTLHMKPRKESLKKKKKEWLKKKRIILDQEVSYWWVLVFWKRLEVHGCIVFLSVTGTLGPDRIRNFLVIHVLHTSLGIFRHPQEAPLNSFCFPHVYSIDILEIYSRKSLGVSK